MLPTQECQNPEILKENISGVYQLKTLAPYSLNLEAKGTSAIHVYFILLHEPGGREFQYHQQPLKPVVPKT